MKSCDASLAAMNNIPQEKCLQRYTETTSRIGNLTRRRPEFEPGFAGAEAAQLE